MSGLLIFILGFILGGISMMVIMCFIQINRVSEMESKIKSLELKLAEEHCLK